MAWKVVGVILGLWPSDPKPGRLVSRSPDSGLIQHLILQPHLPCPQEEGQGEESSLSPWSLLRGKSRPADVLHRAPPLTPHPPTARGVSFQFQQEHLLLSGTSGISYGKINADTHQSPGQSSWPHWGGSGWGAAGLSVPPALEFCSHQGNQASWTRGVFSLCIVRGSVRPGPN